MAELCHGVHFVRALTVKGLQKVKHAQLQQQKWSVVLVKSWQINYALQQGEQVSDFLSAAHLSELHLMHRLRRLTSSDPSFEPPLQTTGCETDCSIWGRGTRQQKGAVAGWNIFPKCNSSVIWIKRTINGNVRCCYHYLHNLILISQALFNYVSRVKSLKWLQFGFWSLTGQEKLKLSGCSKHLVEEFPVIFLQALTSELTSPQWPHLTWPNRLLLSVCCQAEAVAMPPSSAV